MNDNRETIVALAEVATAVRKLRDEVSTQANRMCKPTNTMDWKPIMGLLRGVIKAIPEDVRRRHLDQAKAHLRHRIEDEIRSGRLKIE